MMFEEAGVIGAFVIIKRGLWKALIIGEVEVKYEG
jgi:hypothetical protein